MALDVTVNLTDDREKELVKLTNEWNRGFPEQRTPAQMLRAQVRDWLDLSAQQRVDAEKLGLRAAFKLATLEEQAQIDAILAQYR